MCFFDQHRFLCGHMKWGHFRQHCNREYYRTEEPCGLKLVMQTVPVGQKCKLCEKMDTKTRRREAEFERIILWQREGSRFRASISKSLEMVSSLDAKIYELNLEKNRRLLPDAVKDQPVPPQTALLVSMKRVRKALPMTFETIESPASVLATPDTGSEENAIALDLALTLGLVIQPCYNKLFRMGNGKLVEPCGITLSTCNFATEYGLGSAGFRCVFYVFRTLASSMIMCMSFLESTQTLTAFPNRMIIRNTSSRRVPRIQAIGMLRTRLTCSLDGREVRAIPDSGSEADLMSTEYAQQRGYNIRSGNCGLMFADGSIVACRGVVKAKVRLGTGEVLTQEKAQAAEMPPERPNATLEEDRELAICEESTDSERIGENVRLFTKIVEVDFHVLDDLVADILVGEDTLHSLDAFTNHSSDFTQIEAEKSKVSDCNRIMVLGPLANSARQRVERVNAWMSRMFDREGNQGTATESRADSLTRRLNERDQRENWRREKEKLRIQKLNDKDRQIAEMQEAERQTLYDEDRALLVRAFETTQRQSLQRS